MQRLIAAEYYEKTYQELATNSSAKWARKPDEEVAQLVAELKTGKGLDIGCGLGRNALYMAANGFSAVAIDKSPTAIEHIQRVAKKEGLSVNAICNSILNEGFSREFDLVNSSYVLDEFTQAHAYWLVKIMQDATLSNGFNTIAVCARGTKRKNHFPFKNHFFAEGELVSLYLRAGWKMISHCTILDEKVKHSPVIRLVAQNTSTV